MLFAAGFGTRMGVLTKERPKPLIPVANKTLLDHSLDLAREVSPQRTVVNTHYHADQIERHLEGTEIDLSHESPDVLETGGGLRHALPKLGEGPVYTSNTDAVWKGPNPFALIRDAWRPDKMDALLLCVPLENAVGHSGNGDFLIDAEGRLSRGPGVIYGGVQILRTERLSQIEDQAFSLNLIWTEMAKDQRLYGLVYPGQWCDVGTPQGIELAEAKLGGGDV